MQYAGRFGYIVCAEIERNKKLETSQTSAFLKIEISCIILGMNMDGCSGLYLFALSSRDKKLRREHGRSTSSEPSSARDPYYQMALKGNITGAGFGRDTSLPALAAPATIPAGATYSFYITIANRTLGTSLGFNRGSGERGFNANIEIDAIEQEWLQIDAVLAFWRGMQKLHEHELDI